MAQSVTEGGAAPTGLTTYKDSTGNQSPVIPGMTPGPIDFSGGVAPPYPPVTKQNVTIDPNTGGGGTLAGTGGTGLTPEQMLQQQYAWTNTIAEHYLGRQLSYRELLQVQKTGMTPELLTEHIRSTPSYIPGLTIGQLEDYHTNSKTPFMDWMGREPTDEDIRDLHNRGLTDPQKIDEYIRNRDDVVAMHPGAPLGLKDEQFAIQKNQIDSDYLQNLGRTANNDEARQGIQGKAKGPSQKQDFDVSPQYGQETGGGLESKTLIAPNARNFA